MSVEFDFLRASIVAGIKKSAVKAAKTGKKFVEPMHAGDARIIATQKNALPILAGLEMLSKLPNSKFTFTPEIVNGRLAIRTNVPADGHSGSTACIIIQNAHVVAHGFAERPIDGTTSESAAFIKALAFALAERRIVSLKPRKTRRNLLPQLNA